MIWPAALRWKILRERGWPEDILQAILGHAAYCNVARETRMARTLFAVDELSGLITATALVKPTKSVFDVDASSVRKKMKDKGFARGVSRAGDSKQTHGSLLREGCRLREGCPLREGCCYAPEVDMIC